MSAQPSNIMPFPAAAPSLEYLVAAWIEAKRDEDAANARRIAIEQQICTQQPPKPEGSMTVEAGQYKLTLTGSMSYKADDLEALREITRTWDAQLIPLKSKTELDASGCRWLRTHRPDLWAQLATVITVKPSKTSVKVGV